jgi:hypothetical protein
MTAIKIEKKRVYYYWIGGIKKAAKTFSRKNEYHYAWVFCLKKSDG